MKLTLRTSYWTILALVIALPVIYVLSYFALLDPEQPRGSYVVRAGSSFQRTPRYRALQGVSDVVFSPLLSIDQAVRPSYWKFPLSQFGPWPNHTDGTGVPDEYTHGQEAYRP
jgi:hypothetical protein